MDKFKRAIQERFEYTITESKKPLGGLNPFHNYYNKSGQQLYEIVRSIFVTGKILDVGCGTGRLAKFLMELAGKGYYGFDVNQAFIEYCQATYGGNFSHVDIYHPDMNTCGQIDPSEVVFPYNDKIFDAVISIAVFQHFHIEWVERYISEMARVLCKNGVVIFTIILTNDFSDTVEEPPFKFEFRHEKEWYEYEDKPLYHVAHSEVAIRRCCIRNNLMINEPIKFGHWCKSPLAMTGHDIIIARKRK